MIEVYQTNSNFKMLMGRYNDIGHLGQILNKWIHIVNDNNSYLCKNGYHSYKFKNQNNSICIGCNRDVYETSGCFEIVTNEPFVIKMTNINICKNTEEIEDEGKKEEKVIARYRLL